MAMNVQPFNQPEWEPLPHEGCHGVDHKVLVAQRTFVLALLRFSENATIHEHPAAWPIDVYCLEGRGKFSLGGETVSIAAGQRVRWPPNVAHRLWTEDTTMTTLMVENPPRE
jgi:quercetin dioxygenase-like cupin family protein